MIRVIDECRIFPSTVVYTIYTDYYTIITLIIMESFIKVVDIVEIDILINKVH